MVSPVNNIAKTVNRLLMKLVFGFGVTIRQFFAGNVLTVQLSQYFFYCFPIILPQLTHLLAQKRYLNHASSKNIFTQNIYVNKLIYKLDLVFVVIVNVVFWNRYNSFLIYKCAIRALVFVKFVEFCEILKKIHFALVFFIRSMDNGFYGF